MKSQQLKQLVNYSAIAGAFVLMNENADAQIVYHDIEPDAVLQAEFSWWDNEDSYTIDMNADGLDDFFISMTFTYICGYCWGGSHISVEPLNGNKIASTLDVSYSSCYMYPTFENIVPVFSMGEAIGDDENFTTETVFLFNDDGGLGPGYCMGSGVGNSWVENKYIPVGLKIDGLFHAGWIRLSTYISFADDPLRELKLFDYAYQLTPMTPIHAGEIEGCFTPVADGTTAITSSTAKVNWELVGSADYYELQYRPVGALSWTTKIIDAPKTFRKLNGLTCSTNYEWQVRAICTDGTITDYSPLQTFTTAVCKLENENAIDEENISIWSFANQIHILIDEDIREPVQFILYDETGRNVFSNQISETENTFELNLPDGIYIGTIYSGEKMYSKKIVIQN